MNASSYFLFLSICFALISCESDKSSKSKTKPAEKSEIQSSSGKSDSDFPEPIFQKLTSAQTGIKFENRVVDKENFNLNNFEYMYIGAGIAVGDINNDNLPDLYISSNQGPNRLFFNQGNFTFLDVTGQTGVQAPGEFKTGVAMFDINGDGGLDLFACTTGNSSVANLKNYVDIN